jgi:integrase
VSVVLRGKIWYVDVVRGPHRARLPVGKLQSNALKVEGHVRAILDANVTGVELSDALCTWIARTPTIAQKLVKAGILSASSIQPPRDLHDRVEQYATMLRSRDRTEAHVITTRRNIRWIIEAVGARRFADLEADAIYQVLARQRKAKQRFGATTANSYIRAVRGFCRWAVRRGFIARDPSAALAPFNTATDRRFARRALSLPDLRRLLAVAREALPYCGLTGEERYWLYRLVVETRLRPGSIRALRVADIVLDGPVPHIRIAASSQKARRQSVAPLRRDTAEELQTRFEGLESTDWAFAVPANYLLTTMLKRDLEAAGIPFTTEPQPDCPNGLRVDFYSLKHTGATMVAQVAPPGDLPDLIGVRSLDVARHYLLESDLSGLQQSVEAMPSLYDSDTATD